MPSYGISGAFTTVMHKGIHSYMKGGLITAYCSDKEPQLPIAFTLESSLPRQPQGRSCAATC